MLRLEISKEVESFRTSLKEWLAKNPPPKSTRDSSLDSFIRVGREWQKSLSKGQYVGVHWPKEYGGRGLTLVEEAVVQEELVRARAPQLLGLFGLTMVGPVLIRHGTDAQKSRYLSKILSGEEIWCQGFSEPGAGSDLAAVKTKAAVTDKGFVINGQKIWTSFAHIADSCFVLCRTSDEGAKHKGLTYLLVDMKTKGIKTRPLKQMSGEEEFNEVFFDDVLVPKENVVGKIGDGWSIAISTLMYERVVLTFARQLQSEVALRGMLESKEDLSPTSRIALAREVVNACAVRALAYSHLVDYSEGKSPGPEGSLDKLFWSESFQSLSKLGVKLKGQDGALSEEDSPEVLRYLYSRGRSIAAGTSEIQRNIIAERLLELPRLKYIG